MTFEGTKIQLILSFWNVELSLPLRVEAVLPCDVTPPTLEVRLEGPVETVPKAELAAVVAEDMEP